MTDKLLKELNIAIDLKNVQEIRLRRDLPIKYLENGVYKIYKKGGVETVATKDMIDRAIKTITESSYYAFEKSFAKGFLNYHGAKITLCGKGVDENGTLSGIRNVSSMNIRIPKDIDCVEENIAKEVFLNDKSVLISGKVCSGKTTLLRSLIKKCPYPITVADEKGELLLGSRSLGENADVMSFVSKEAVLDLGVKGLSPRYIAFDEVTDFNIVKRALDFGIKVIATTFGEDEELSQDKRSLFDMLILTYCDEKGFRKRVRRFE